MAEGVAKQGGLFLRTTMEALESVSSPSVAHAIVWAALEASSLTTVPEEIAPFRSFVEGPLRIEVQRQLGAESVSHVLERLGHVLWMATSDVHALSVARDWVGLTKPVVDDSAAAEAEAESGEYAVSKPPFAPSGASEHKRPTVPAPDLASASSKPPRARSPIPPAARSPIPAPARSPMPVSVPRPPSPGITIGKLTVPKLTRVASRPLPTCVMVLSLDPMFTTQATVEIGERCPVVRVMSPTDLARVASCSGDRLVVLVDTALPSIDLKTFVDLAPVLPPSTRIVLWGVDERQRVRLVSMFPIAQGWTVSGDSTQPGELALTQF